MDNARIDYFDIVKGIGILCVIAGHMGISPIDSVVFTFHMPLFFLISGYFISTKISFKDFCNKKFKQLLFPYIFTSICLILLKIPVNFVLGNSKNIPNEVLNTAIAAFYGSGSNNVKMPFGIEMIGAIWFLLALLWALIIVKYAIKFKWSAGLILIIAVISYISSQYIWLPFCIQAGGVASIFVYIGYLAKKKQLIEDKINWIVVVFGIICLIIEVKNDFVIAMVSNYYSHGIADIIGAVLICYSLVSISKLIDGNNIFKKFLCFLGKNSLMILCFHLLELNNFPWTYIYDIFEYISIPKAFAYICVFAGKVMFSTVCIFVIMRIGFSKRIFGKE